MESGLAYCHKRPGLTPMATASKSIVAVGDEFIEIEGKKLRALKVAM